MNAPRVSIGLPVWNGEKYIRSALDSVLQQDYADFELIISDNASTDATESICREYAAKDSRIRYYRNEKNIGATRNFNRVFELARGEFFKWITHDDEIADSFIRRCMETFQEAPSDTVLVCSRSQVSDSDGDVFTISQLGMKTSPKPACRLASLISTSPQGHPHPIWGVIRSKTLQKTRLHRTVWADHILLAELAMLGNFVEVPEDLQMWRMHPQNAMKVYRTPRELLGWHDPDKANHRIVLPLWLAVDLEYFRAVRHIPLAPTQRLACYCVAAWFACSRKVWSIRRVLALKTRFKKRFQKLGPQSYHVADRWQNAQEPSRHQTFKRR